MDSDRNSDVCPPGVEVPYGSLSHEALMGLVEEFVSREGTDYGHAEQSFDAKVKAVLRQLEAGRAVVLFDRDAGSCNIIAKDDFSNR